MLDLKRFNKLLKGMSWLDEFGNPDNAADWRFMRTFSPYHNIKRGVHYPPILLTSSTLDDRLHPAHARKMTAALKEAGHEALYYENREGGHRGASNVEESAFIYALGYSFFWKHLGPAQAGAAAGAASATPGATTSP
jgi:prolyl oligopeptidase